MYDDYSGYYDYDPDGERVDRRDNIIHKLRQQMREQRRTIETEKMIRESHPAVKEAYEKYLVLLELARTSQ